jgi:hypothetical protein
MKFDSSCVGQEYLQKTINGSIVTSKSIILVMEIRKTNMEATPYCVDFGTAVSWQLG